MIIRLIEIIFDPIIGSIIDNTQTRWGKFKPWLVVGGLCLSLMIMLMFLTLEVSKVAIGRYLRSSLFFHLSS